MATSRTVAGAHRDFRRHYHYGAAVLAAGTATASAYTRRWREQKLSDLTPAASCGTFHAPGADGADSSKALAASVNQVAKDQGDAFVRSSSQAQNVGKRRRRDLRELSTTVARAGLMGTSVPDAKSVAAELNVIRKWHQDRGFRGGLVLRELNQPLFEDDEVEGGDDVEQIPRHELDHRECYYLYYEVMPNGELRQQIFCRGTTLAADVGTCLAARLKYDGELECGLHAGFLGHAERLVRDVEPLLVPASGHRRATVEICGHSLGGAVAFIAALKLRKRGHNVVRVTSVAAPRFCSGDPDARRSLARWLPPDALRIEDDLDAVTYLPPFFNGRLGDKLWFVSGGRDKDGVRREKSAYFIPAEATIEEMAWVDSSWANTRIPETMAHISKIHRVPSYVEQVDSLAEEINRR